MPTPPVLHVRRLLSPALYGQALSALHSLLDENEVLPLMHQVLEGVNYLHATLGIAHRDLSLENVLLSRGVCKITDFGLSTDARVECRVGKEFYMAAEIVAGEQYNPALVAGHHVVHLAPLLPLASPSENGF